MFVSLAVDFFAFMNELQAPVGFGNSDGSSLSKRDTDLKSMELKCEVLGMVPTQTEAGPIYDFETAMYGCAVLSLLHFRGGVSLDMIQATGESESAELVRMSTKIKRQRKKTGVEMEQTTRLVMKNTITQLPWKADSKQLADRFQSLAELPPELLISTKMQEERDRKQLKNKKPRLNNNVRRDLVRRGSNIKFLTGAGKQKAKW